MSRTEKLLETLGVDPVGFIDPDLPRGYFSNSQYSMWLKCGHAYERRYILGEPTIPGPAMVRGISVHEGTDHLLKQKLKGETPSLEQALEITSSKFDKLAEQVEQWDPTEPQGKVKDATVALLTHFGIYVLPKLNPISSEEGFAVKMAGIPLVGYIDMVEEVAAAPTQGLSPEDAALAPKKKVVVDWKTTTKKWTQDQVDKSPQGTIYTEVKGTPHFRVDQLIALKKGPSHNSTESLRGPQETEIFKEHLVEVVEHIKAGVFPKTSIDSWACSPKWCDYWDKCRGKKRHTTPVLKAS